MHAPGHRSLGGLSACPYVLAVPTGYVTPWVDFGMRFLGLLVVIMVSIVPDWDQPRYKERTHFGAWMTRGVTRLALKYIHTDNDEPKNLKDTHREFSHTIEFCVLAGAVTYWYFAIIPYTTDGALFFAGCVTIGCLSHVLGDLFTPSGVPVSIIYNLIFYREAWRTHTLYRTRLGYRSGEESPALLNVMWISTVVILLVYTGLIWPIFHLLTL